MAAKQKNPPRNFSDEYDESSNINGLNIFKKSLEKLFFAEVKIKSIQKDSKPHIILTINCNFNLIEGLVQLNSSNWGGFCRKASKFGYSFYELAIINLQEKNIFEIIIDEIAIHFKDTSLFISKLAHQNISDHLCDILNAVSENYLYFTKGLIEYPYEIFIPVFEEPTINSPQHNSIKNSYFNYWGIYYQSEKKSDSRIYDLVTKTIIDSDFSLIHKEQ